MPKTAPSQTYAHVGEPKGAYDAPMLPGCGHIARQAWGQGSQPHCSPWAMLLTLGCLQHPRRHPRVGAPDTPTGNSGRASPEGPAGWVDMCTAGGGVGACCIGDLAYPWLTPTLPRAYLRAWGGGGRQGGQYEPVG